MSLGKIAAASRRRNARAARAPGAQVSQELNYARAAHWCLPDRRLGPGAVRQDIRSRSITWPPGEGQLTELAVHWGLHSPEEAARVVCMVQMQDQLAARHVEQWAACLNVPVSAPWASQVPAWRQEAMSQELSARLECVAELLPRADDSVRPYLAGLLTPDALEHFAEPRALAFALMESGVPGECLEEALAATGMQQEHASGLGY